MELGGLGLDVGFHSSENALDCDTSRLKWTSANARSAGFKQDGSGFWSDDCRSSKLAKTNSGFSPSSASSDVHMLSFSSSSSSKPETSTLPYFQQLPGAPPKSAGYYSGALNTSACMYLLNGVRGPFTPSQWLELEQQALIYKYLTANEPIPAHLLIPIKKALESAGLFGFNAGPLRPTSWGWGPFHLGYSNSTDPEPGRCRRTDGKKWRCSRDAVPDQKYCERHINRGRHRSRKLVEAQAAKSSATKPPLVAPGAGLSSNSFDINPTMNNPLMDRMQDTTQPSFLTLSGSQKNSSFCSGNDGSSILWPGLQLPSENMGSSDFSPLRHSQQLEMGLGVGAQSHDNRQANWMSSSWEPSMGGPLGEALQSSGGAQGEGKKTAALNLLPKGWEGIGSYQLSSSSPTGVLQKSALVSLSNSSAGSSPRADNSKTVE